MGRLSRLFFLGTAALVITSIVLLKDRKFDYDVEIPNPFKSVDSLEEACKLVGFEFKVPENIPGYEMKNIEIIEDEMIQIHYVNPSNDTLTIRKARGNDDISGDYNDYPRVDYQSLDDTKITVKGTGDIINVLTFTEGGFTYAVQSNEGFDENLLTLFATEIR